MAQPLTSDPVVDVSDFGEYQRWVEDHGPVGSTEDIVYDSLDAELLADFRERPN
jgi:hypothetical protein